MSVATERLYTTRLEVSTLFFDEQNLIVRPQIPSRAGLIVELSRNLSRTGHIFNLGRNGRAETCVVELVRNIYGSELKLKRFWSHWLKHLP